MRDESAEWVTAVLGGVVGVALLVYYAWVYIVGFFAVLAVLELGRRYVQNKEKAEVVEQEEPSATEPEPIVAKAGSDAPPYDDAYRRHKDLGYANVDLWVYPTLGVIRRTVKVRDDALIKVHGQRIKLEEKSIEDISPEDLMNDTVAEVAILLAQPVPEMPEVKEGSRQRRRKARAAARKDMADKIVTEQPAPVQEVAPVEAKTTKPRKRPQAVYEGEAIRYGAETKDGENGKYQTYSLHLLDPKVDAPHSLNGVDLERAIKEAQVQPGDRVRVEKLGKTSVDLPNGKTGYKNLWAVTKLA